MVVLDSEYLLLDWQRRYFIFKIQANPRVYQRQSNSIGPDEHSQSDEVDTLECLQYFSVILATNCAPHSFKCGIVTVFDGATFDFAAIK